MTAKSQTIARLVPAIRAVADWLRDFNAPHAIIGGIAAGLLGRARNTVDVDAVVLVDPDHLSALLASAIRFDISPRIENILEFAAYSRVLLLKHGASGVEVDISLAGMPFEEELLERAVETEISGIVVRLPTVEDLIVMKSVANRGRDWADIEGLIDAHPKLDTARILLWAGRFAEIMESPEVVEQLEKLLNAAQPKLRAVTVSKSAPITHTAKRQSALKKTATAVPTRQKSTKKVAKKKPASPTGLKKSGAPKKGAGSKPRKRPPD